MGNTETIKVTISKANFKKALEYRHLTVKALGEDFNRGGTVLRSEKTIWRNLKAGKMQEDLLDSIARYIDVDPKYLQGGYEVHSDDPEIDEELNRTLHPSLFPYFMKKWRYDPNDIMTQGIAYRNMILIHHFIAEEQFLAKTLDEQEKFLVELEDAICPVLRKHFTVDAKGRTDHPELYRLQYETESYYDELRMPEELRWK